MIASLDGKTNNNNGVYMMAVVDVCYPVSVVEMARGANSGNASALLGMPSRENFAPPQQPNSYSATILRCSR